MGSVGQVKAPHVARAVSFAAMGAALSAVDAVIVRALDGGVHPLMITFWRALFGGLAILPIVLIRRDLLVSAYPWRQHLLRAGLKLVALACFFAAFARGPLADVTALAFTSPIFVVLGAALLLGERLGGIKLFALLLGFAGTLVVISPAGAGASIAMAFALTGAMVQAVIQLMLKSMSGRDNTITLVIWNLLLTIPLAFVLALPFFTLPDLHQLGLLALQGVLGALCMGFMTHAFHLADASVVAPVDFLRLPLVAALGFVLFGELASTGTWIGGLMICAAALFAAQATRVRRSFLRK